MMKAIMLSPRARQQFDDLVKAGKSCEEIAETMGHSVRWAQGWRRKLHGTMPRTNAVNHAEIDRLIVEGKATKEIMAALKVGKTSIMTRRAHLSRNGLIPESRRYFIKPKITNTVTDAPLIPPAERLDLALKAKARALGQPMAWMRETWLRGQAGRNFMAQGGYL